MKYFRTKIDDKYIISRLQQKELMNLKPTMAFDSHFFPLLTKISLKPFIDNLPINVGIDLHIIGNLIIKAEVDRGYFSNDHESMLGNLSPFQALMAIERVHMSAPIFYQLALLTAYFSLAARPMNDNYKYAAIAMELARIAHHLNVVKNVLYCCGLDRTATLATQCEHIIRPFLSFSSRIYPQSEERKLSPISVSTITRSLSEAIECAKQLAFEISMKEILRQLLLKKCFINLPTASSMGLTGGYFRANRYAYDVRTKEDNAFYDSSFLAVTTEGGDAYARFSLRLMEITGSLKWLKKQISSATYSQLYHLTVDENLLLDSVNKSAVSEIEGPEGIIKISIFVDDNNKKIIRLRSPAYFIAQAIPHFLSHRKLCDLSLLLYSLGITAEEIDK